ncbi:alpha/beta fold hydrolase [Gilvibacter sediminis]|uniref:alpha/beta fold hydrolase n=1 Tax=Gilvibacter sediminis TaxID=379071 RepID=UPI00234FF65B|nr:alpha/beta hydrolase [Gilvibacter sediminis]MDC7997091.1 alpha/beta hydrolase [Gilvibacter sediminis]
MTKLQNSDSLFYTVQGAGPNLVLLHGFLEDHSMWDGLVNDLAEHARVICIDLPGHGRSGLSEEATMESFAKDVLKVLDYLKADQINLAGHSMGGYVALALTEMAPERVDKLCLLNSTFYPDTEERKQKRRQAISVIKEDPKLFVRTVIPSLFPTSVRKVMQPTIDDLIKKASLMTAEAIIAATEAMIHRPDRSALFFKRKQNSYLVIGKQDPLVNISALTEAVNQHQNQKLILEGGHMSPFENIDKVRIFLTKFTS